MFARLLQYLRSNLLTVAALAFLVAVLGYQQIPNLLHSHAFVGRMAPDFVLSDLQGRKARLSELRGRPVLLNFWATWCGPCLMEIPALKAAQAELGKHGFQILSISGERAGVLSRFAKERSGLGYRVFSDRRGRALGPYRVRMFPTLVYVDRDGRIRNVSYGFSPLLKWRLRYYVKGTPF